MAISMLFLLDTHKHIGNTLLKVENGHKEVGVSKNDTITLEVSLVNYHTECIGTMSVQYSSAMNQLVMTHTHYR